MEIVVERAKWSGAFVMWLGTERLGSSPVPFLTAARILLYRGHSPGQELTMRRKGEKNWSLRATIGEAAKWDVRADRFRPWKPNRGCAASLRTAVLDLQAITLPDHA